MSVFRFLNKLGPYLEDNIPEISPCLYVIRQPFIVNMIWKLVKPFLHKLTLEKFRFISDKHMKDELLKIIPKENLPSIYGGKDTDFEELYP